ncbi:MAG: hypothetical protein GX409_07350 [candidate division Zixibacteria bacterium]|nr:hypothetical protein [candidate division Zixibacteria bacterium]
MKIITVIFSLMAIMAMAAGAFAVETTVEGRIYSSWWMNLTDTTMTHDSATVDLKGWNQFSLDRSYVTIKSKLSDYTSLNITTDLRDSKDEMLNSFAGYMIVLKYGYIDWKLNFAPEKLSLRLGLQPTMYVDAIDAMMWGHRYVLNSVGDLNKMLTTSDLGASVNYNIGENSKYGFAGLSIWNGTSYTDLNEQNKSKDINPYVVFKPLAGNPHFEKTMIAAQFYTGTQNIPIDTTMKAGDYKRQIISVGANLAYKDLFNVGGEFWSNTLGQGPNVDDLKSSAISIFGNLKFRSLVGEDSPFRTLGLFGRYDIVDPNTDVDDNGNSLLIAGVECTPVKGVAASLNFRNKSYQADIKSESFLFLNTEFKF